MWYKDVINKMDKNKIYTRSQVFEYILKEKPNISNNSLKWIIADMVKNKAICNIQRGMYSLTDGKQNLENFIPVLNNDFTKICKKIDTRFPLVEYVCFESMHLNEFLNHLIAKNSFFIFVEKEASSAVFRYLQEEGLNNILYKPSVKEYDYYWQENTIFVLDLVSEYPKNKFNNHVMSIEHLLVDAVCEKCISRLFSKNEIDNIYEGSCKRYNIEYSKLYRYARRRNKENEIRQIVEGVTSAYKQ